MSIKDNIEAVKQELNTEEQFLENLIRTERIIKKYKNYLMITGLIIVLFFVVYKINHYLEFEKKIKANEAYLILQKNPKDGVAKEILKNNNINLYTMFETKQNIENNRSINIANLDLDEIQKSLIGYYNASKSSNKENLSKYENSDNAILKDYALLQEGFLFLKEGKREVALMKFSEIKSDSQLKGIIDSLTHYKVPEVTLDDIRKKESKVLNIPRVKNISIPTVEEK